MIAVLEREGLTVAGIHEGKFNRGIVAGVTFITGRFGAWVGGPYQTQRAYSRALEAGGRDVRLVSIPKLTASDKRAKFGRLATAARDAVHLLGMIGTENGRTLIFLGVWHPAFLLGLPWALVVCKPRATVLVPTQSLSPVDWHKRPRLKRLLRPYVALLLTRIDLVIFASSGERDEALPRLSNERTCVVHHPMVPPAIEPIDSRSRDISGTPNIAILGRVHPQKDHLLAIETLRHSPMATLHIIGSGDPDYVDHLQVVAASWGVQSRIVWHGWLPREDALQIVRSCDLALVTSRAENYCHAAVEAMYVGTPVLMVDRIASSSDFASQGAVRLAKADPIYLAEAISSITLDPAELRRLAAAGRIFAQRQASVRALWDIQEAIARSERTVMGSVDSPGVREFHARQTEGERK